jgi:ATP-dependent DNA helicase RecG
MSQKLVPEMHDIGNLLLLGEGERVEFKRGWSRDIGEKLVSFANTEGGTLLVGVAKDGTVVGLADEELAETEGRVANVCNSVQPPLVPRIRIVEHCGHRLLRVDVDKATLEVHYLGGICWVRVGSTTRKATPEEVTRLLQDKGKLATDVFPVREATWDDLQHDKLARYIRERLRGEGPRRPDGRSLVEMAERLKLVRREGEQVWPTVAGVLFFGVYPQQFLVQSIVRAGRFKGTDVNSRLILDRAGLTGTLDEIIDAGVRFVGRNMKIARLRGEVRQDIPEYPLDAVQEAIANAVIHRDYTILGQEVNLLMFDDRLEIRSPGGLAGPVTLENLDRVHFARNPTLAQIAFELGKAERMGTGIHRIRHEMAELGSPPPEFYADRSSFTVVLRSRHSSPLEVER